MRYASTINEEVMRTRIAELERQIAEARKVVEAARCIKHWHDAMRDNSGMVVSADHVRDLWVALADYDAINPTQPKEKP